MTRIDDFGVIRETGDDFLSSLEARAQDLHALGPSWYLACKNLQEGLRWKMQTKTRTEVGRISPSDTMARLARGEPIVFLDTRNPKAWAESDIKLPGAIRVEADRVRGHLAEIPRGRPIVAYCT